MRFPNLLNTVANRRQLLKQTACGFGGVALNWMLTQGNVQAKPSVPPTRPKAKRIIFLFMAGGPSQPDLFDPKSLIIKNHGKTVAAPVDDTQLRVGVDQYLAMAPVAPVRPRGNSGMMISDLLPNIGGLADDLCLLKGMHTDNKAHSPATLQFHTGALTEARPSLGAWVSYGLGSENQDLPSFITIHPPSDGRTYGSSFLPAKHQGMAVRVPAKESDVAIKYLRDAETDLQTQQRRIDFLQTMNRRLLKEHSTPQMNGMIESFELAFRMQTETPQLVDLENETDETHQLYGLGDPATDRNGRACLLARRLSEAGVRFVQVSIGGWDHHGDIPNNLRKSCQQADRPIAGLITDLKRRGLLDETLVVWSGEFGRSPWSQDLSGTSPIEKHGREHQHESFCSILVGGGVRGGLTYGATDDFGYRPIQGRVHLYDLHATMLYLLGLDHEQLTHRHAGRDFRLTDVYGNVVHPILT